MGRRSSRECNILQGYYKLTRIDNGKTDVGYVLCENIFEVMEGGREINHQHFEVIKILKWRLRYTIEDTADKSEDSI